MAFVYILQSKKSGHYYVGSTEHFEQRLKQHNNGNVHTTKRMLPLELMLKQEYPTIDVARKIEKRIKDLKRHDYIQKMISDGHIRISVNK